jgi:hypothetical protein
LAVSGPAITHSSIERALTRLGRAPTEAEVVYEVHGLLLTLPVLTRLPSAFEFCAGSAVITARWMAQTDFPPLSALGAPSLAEALKYAPEASFAHVPLARGKQRILRPELFIRDAPCFAAQAVFWTSAAAPDTFERWLRHAQPALHLEVSAVEEVGKVSQAWAQLVHGLQVA